MSTSVQTDQPAGIDELRQDVIAFVRKHCSQRQLDDWGSRINNRDEPPLGGEVLEFIKLEDPALLGRLKALLGDEKRQEDERCVSSFTRDALVQYRSLVLGCK